MIPEFSSHSVLSVSFDLPYNRSRPLPETQWFSDAHAPFNSGSWKVVHSFTPGWVRIECHGGATPVRAKSVVLRTGAYQGSNKSERGSVQYGLTPGTAFPPRPSWDLECQMNQIGTRNWCTLEIALMDKAAGAAPVRPSDLKEVATRNAELIQSHAPNDVMFTFARTERVLFANSGALKQASPYFSTMLNSGFSESSTAPVQPVPTPAPSTENEAPAVEVDDESDPANDSDDEVDSLLPPPVNATFTCPPGVHEVPVSSTAYTTYQATLFWLAFGFIQFAPISGPPLLLDDPDAADLISHDRPTKRARLDPTATDADLALPLPASPKSVYKLAHFLELPKLMTIALSNFKAQLTSDNVLYQLTTDLATEHGPVRNALLAFASTNWDKVLASPVTSKLCESELLKEIPNGLELVPALVSLARNASEGCTCG